MNAQLSNFTNYNDINFYENPDLDFKPNRTKKKKGVLYILSIVLFTFGFLLSCLNAFIIFIKYSRINSPYDIIYSSGIIIASILIIIGLFLLATKVFKKNGILLLFSIIYLIGCFSSTASTTQAIIKEGNMNKAAIVKFVSICNSIASSQDISGEIFDKSVYGELTPILNLVKEYGTKSNNLTTNINQYISSIGVENLLSIDILGSTEKINNAKGTISDSLKIYDKYETEYNDLLTDFETSASNLELPKSFKSSFLDGFSKSQVENRNNINDFFKVERDIFSKANTILDFLLSAQGKYIVQNNQILFRTDADLNKYNAYIEDIQKLAQKEADIQKTISESKQKALDKLNQYNKDLL